VREAEDHMARHVIGRLPVVSRETRRLVGIVTRSDVLMAHRARVRDQSHQTAATH
jgi:chloride channel protein, CIC family